MAAVVAALSFGATVMTYDGYLQPRVSVEPAGQIVASDSSTWAFRILNDGALRLTDLQPMIGICYISPACQPVQPCDGPLPDGSRIAPARWKVRELVPDDAETIEVGDELKLRSGRICSADITVYVRFKLWFLPWRGEKSFRFRTEAAADGTLKWRSEPRRW